MAAHQDSLVRWPVSIVCPVDENSSLPTPTVLWNHQILKLHSRQPITYVLAAPNIGKKTIYNAAVLTK